MGERTSNLEKNKNVTTDVNDSNENASPEEIRSQINETRQQMGETINENQDRLSVENITDQVKDEVSDQISNAWQSTKETVYKTTAQKTGDIMNYVNKGIEEISDTKVVKTARRNPIALTLIGAGLGMLAYNAYRSNSRDSANGKYRGSASTSTYDNLENINDESKLDTAKNKVKNAYESVSETAGNAYSSAASALSSTYDSVGNAGTQVKETAQDLTHKAKDSYDYYIEENPLAVGAVALAAGALVGLAVPSTKYESELVGDKRDALINKAEEKITNVVGSKVEKAKAVAANTFETAKETAQEEAKNKNLV